VSGSVPFFRVGRFEVRVEFGSVLRGSSGFLGGRSSVEFCSVLRGRSSVEFGSVLRGSSGGRSSCRDRFRSSGSVGGSSGSKFVAGRFVPFRYHEKTLPSGVLGVFGSVKFHGSVIDGTRAVVVEARAELVVDDSFVDGFVDHLVHHKLAQYIV
jgi:hypothetical protein